MEKDQSAKLITIILPKGKATSLMQQLADKGFRRIQFAFARGSDIGDPLSRKGLPPEVEKEIVTVIVSESQAEELFEFMYEKAQIGESLGNGLMYMTSLSSATAFSLPEMTSLNPSQRKDSSDIASH